VLGIHGIAGLLAGARAVVGVDTGLTHLAAALGRPVVALYCGTDPGLTGVYAGQGAPVRNLGGKARVPEVPAVLAALDEVVGGDPA
jgi:heptosyltransferase-1